MQPDCDALRGADVQSLRRMLLGLSPGGGDERGDETMAGILWLVLVVLLALWLIGLVANIGGGLIHLLLVVAVIVLLYNLLMSRRTTR
jgi:hypothetical protein